MKKLLLISIAILLTACQSISQLTDNQVKDTEAAKAIQAQENKQNKTLEMESFLGHKDKDLNSYWARNPHAFINQYQNNNQQSNLSISDYVETMSIKLIKNMQYVTAKNPIGVASFVPVDSNLEETNLFGIHLAESFQHQMQTLGLSVIDYKATGTIRVTETGDYSLSRDIDELRQWQPIEYVLTGTFSHTKKGIQVHARLIGIESRAIVASAQTLIPNNVTNELTALSNTKDGVKLMQR